MTAVLGAAAVAACLVAPTGAATAQGREAAAGALGGRVVDASTGQPLAGVEVRLTGRDTVVVRSGPKGAWLIANLSAGQYTIRARGLGHLPREMQVQVAGGQRTHYELRLDAAPLSLDQVVVTAARRDQRLTDAVVTTEVVTRADIERTGAADLASVLTEQTGVALQGGHPAGAGVMLQGFGAERVLVLLDGQPVAGRIAGVLDVSRIPTAMVERIEVVKGPQSTMYGSEAMGGIVNILTRTPPSGVLGATLRATAGSQARRDGGASLTLGRGPFAAAFDVSRRSIATTPGIDVVDGALARRLDLSSKLRWAPDPARTLEASLVTLDERRRWRSGTLYNFGDSQQWSGRLRGVRARGRHRLTPTFSASVFDHLSRSSTQPKPIAGDTGQRQLQRVYQAELLYNGRLGSGAAHALDVGLLMRRDETETVRVPGGLRSITALEPFAQLELAATPVLSLVPGVRLSRSSQWRTHVTPRLAARWQAADGLTVRASGGEGYRVPDFKELYMFFVNDNVGYAVRGNPDLRPERSRNLTVGAEWTSGRTYLRGQLFQNRFRDFIETRPASGPGEAPVYEYGNLDNGSTRGMELEGGVVVPGLRLEASYSGLSTRDDATDRPLLGRPTHSARATAGITLPFTLRTSVSALYTGRTAMRRDAPSGAITSWRDAYFRVDARVARRLAGTLSGTELVLGADNLFDARPAEWAGFTGRHIYTALSWTMNHTITTRRSTASSGEEDLR